MNLFFLISLLFLAVLGHHGCMDFSLVVETGSYAGYGMMASHSSGLSCRGAQAQ